MRRGILALLCSILILQGCDYSTRPDLSDLVVSKVPGYSYGLIIEDDQGRALEIGQISNPDAPCVADFEDVRLPRAQFIFLPKGYRFHGRGVQDAPITMWASRHLCDEPPPPVLATGVGHYVVNASHATTDTTDDLLSWVVNVEGTIGEQRVHIRLHFVQTASGEIRQQQVLVRYSP